MSYETNVYYSPEKYDLELIGTLEDPEACYSFDTLIALQHKETKRLYWASDRGCSCPSPFEDVDGIGGLTSIVDDTESWNEFQKAVENHAVPEYFYNDEQLAEWKEANGSFQADKTELLSKVARLLREQ